MRLVLGCHVRHLWSSVRGGEWATIETDSSTRLIQILALKSGGFCTPIIAPMCLLNAGSLKYSEARPM